MKFYSNINVKFDLASLAETMRLTKGMPEYTEFSDLVAELQPLCDPKALLEETIVTEIREDGVQCEHGRFSCPLLGQLVVEGAWIFPFIATCGNEIGKYDIKSDDPLKLYWFDFIKEHALEEAMCFVKNDLSDRFPDKVITSLIPMDEDIWNLTGLKEVFAVFPDDAVKKIGVELTEYLFMEPNKSRAGVFFVSDKEVSLCSMCKLKKCKHCPVSWS